MEDASLAVPRAQHMRMPTVTSNILRRMEKSNTAQPLITSVGGGPSDLALLLTLHKRGIPAILYERGPSFASRGHLGGFFDLARGA